MTIGQRIMQIRTIAGLSQEEFGEKLGTSRQTVSKWELDINIPDVEKIVRMSRLFSVTTDSILVDGISSFDEVGEAYVCGIYKSDTMEIVETERVALVFWSNIDKTLYGVKAYIGYGLKKKLQAVCEYRETDKKIHYAYVTDTGIVLSSCDLIQKQLGEKYDNTTKNSLYRTEVFYVSHDNLPLPTVDEVGIKQCLTKWRMATTLNMTTTRFSIFICTDKTEYVVDIAPKDDNIYCGISYNVTSELGLLCGKQFFRIRHYRDNAEPFCHSYCNLGLMMPTFLTVSTAECVSGSCTTTSQGMFCGIKRYTNDEIVLCGCGGDEYVYARLAPKLERYSSN